MDAIIKFISEPWVATIIGILGLLAAIYFYMRSRRITKLAYQYDDVTLLGTPEAAFEDEIEIFFSGTKVPRVTASKVVFWNDGNTTIDSSQMVESDPLRAEVSGDFRILRINILKVSRKVNSISLYHQKDIHNAAHIRFDFLDPKDGVVFEVLHTGSRDDLNILGTIKGMPSGLSNYGKLMMTHKRGILLIKYLLTVSLIGIIMMIVGLLGYVGYIDDFYIFGKICAVPKTYLAFMVGGFLYFSFPAILLWIRRKRYPTRLELESINENNIRSFLELLSQVIR